MKRFSDWNKSPQQEYIDGLLEKYEGYPHTLSESERELVGEITLASNNANMDSTDDCTPTKQPKQQTSQKQACNKRKIVIAQTGFLGKGKKGNLFFPSVDSRGTTPRRDEQHSRKY